MLKSFENSNNFIQTESGNIISKLAKICSSKSIQLQGNCIITDKTILRGDLKSSNWSIIIGKYCKLDGCQVKPPCKTYKGVFSYYPIKIGDYVEIVFFLIKGE